MGPDRQRLDAANVWIAAAGIASIWFSCAFTPVNTDLGWMLRFGWDALRTGALPRENVESFTEPHHAVVMPEWATCLGLFSAFRLWGDTGLIAVKWALAALTMVGVTAAVSGTSASRLARLLAVLVAGQFLWIGFELIRSQMMTFALLAAFVWAALSRRRYPLWCCVPGMLLWVNAHGGFWSGFFVLTGLCVARAFEEHRGWSPRTRPLTDYALVPLLCAAVLVLNPYGLAVPKLTWVIVQDDSRFLVREWLPLWEWSALTSAERTSTIILGAVALFTALLMPRRQLRLWCLWTLAIAVAPGAIRHLRLVPILLAPVLASALDAVLTRLQRDRPAALERVFLPLAAGATLVFGALFGLRVREALHFVDPSAPSPARAIQVMKLNGLSGNVWNDYDWGGYLQLALPEARVACDGRHGFAYSAALIEKSVNFGVSADDPIATVTHYGADLALLPPENLATARLVSAGGFTALYCDAEACVLSRRPEHRGEFRKSLRVPEGPVRLSDLFARQERASPR